MSKLLLTLATLISTLFSQPQKPVYQTELQTYLAEKTPVKTESRFTQKEFTETETLPFETIYKSDDSIEFGTTKTITDGKKGLIKTTYVVNYYDGKEIERIVKNVEKTEPRNVVVSKGTKIIWKEETSDRCGKFKYWQKYDKVYMTTYTPQCEGCDAWTSIGLKAGYGIIAVDPKKIPYYTKVCIPGYGTAVAGDTGGAMRSYPGLLIDLGFPDLTPAHKWMTTGRYDMYILNNEDLLDKFFIVGTK